MKKEEYYTYQKAYFVEQWGTKIVEGKAFIITLIDFYEKTVAMFIADGEVYPKMVSKSQVVFTKEHADNLLSRESMGYKDYCEKQVKKYSEKLKSLQS